MLNAEVGGGHLPERSLCDPPRSERSAPAGDDRGEQLVSIEVSSRVSDLGLTLKVVDVMLTAP